MVLRTNLNPKQCLDICIYALVTNLTGSRYLHSVKHLLEPSSLILNSLEVTLWCSIFLQCCFKSQDRIMKSLTATPSLETYTMILQHIQVYVFFNP